MTRTQTRTPKPAPRNTKARTRRPTTRPVSLVKLTKPRPTDTAPKAPVVHQLREGVRRARAAHDDTEPLTLADITAGLQARTADSETPKEHPDHA